MRFALAGNQNCGKTTLFNQLTGSNQHVGNFPGVTVDRKSGAIRNLSLIHISCIPLISTVPVHFSTLATASFRACSAAAIWVEERDSSSMTLN